MGAFPDGSAAAGSAGSWHDIGTAPSSRGTPAAPPPVLRPPGVAAPPPPSGPSVRAPLRRSRTDKILGGVNGGLAEYTGIDALLWRVGFVALTLAGGAGIVVYLLLWLLMPAGPPAGAGALARPAGAPAGRPPVAGSGHHDRGPAHPDGRDGDVQQLQPVGDPPARLLRRRRSWSSALGLVAAAFATGRTARGGLIALGVVLSLGLVAAASEPWEGTGAARATGPTARAPRRGVRDVYRGGVGDLTLDLTRIDVGDRRGRSARGSSTARATSGCSCPSRPTSS